MSTQTTQEKLRRTVGVFGATLLGLGSILGAGVYFAIPDMSAYAGTSLIIPIVAAALLATCNALSSAQLAACYPVSGGTYEYGYQLLSPWAGFAAGWLFVCAKSASAATATLQVTANLLNAPAPMAGCGIVAAMTLLVICGLRRSTWMNTVLVGLTITGLLVFTVSAITGPATDGERNETPLQSPMSAAPDPVPTNETVVDSENLTLRTFLEMAALMFVGFTGYGRIATLGEEIRNPRRNIPFAVLTTLSVSTLLYLLVAFGVNQCSSEATSGATLTSLSSSAGGVVTRIVAVGAVAAMLGVLLNLLLGLSRVVLAMARRSDLPSFLATLNSSRTTPVYAVALVAIIVTGLVLTQTSRTAWSLSAVTVLIYYGLTNLAALKLPPEHRLYPRWIAIIGLCGCLLLAAHVEMKMCLTGGFILLVGLIGRAAAQTFRRTS
ncbi:MAG: APC family permease [Fuerstiella sp.]|nr:APC family permease [Fuerstiella sp.]